MLIVRCSLQCVVWFVVTVVFLYGVVCLLCVVCLSLFLSLFVVGGLLLGVVCRCVLLVVDERCLRLLLLFWVAGCWSVFVRCCVMVVVDCCCLLYGL